MTRPWNKALEKKALSAKRSKLTEALEKALKKAPPVCTI